MPKFVSKVTGVKISVSDESATTLGSEWVPVPVKEDQPKRK